MLSGRWLIAGAALAAGCNTTEMKPAREFPIRAERCHEEALNIAKWLQRTAVRTKDGLAWPRVPDAPTEAGSYDHALYSGSAGPTLFFLELAASEPDELRRKEYITVATAAADELLATLPEKPDGEACGLYTGLAGIGFTLYTAADVLHEGRYREGARRCVDKLHAAARVAGSGIEWGDTTDVIAGAAGIGFFLLYARAHDAKDPAGELALDLATRAGRRLQDLSIRETVGRSWKMDPKFPRVMPNFSHGTAGIACFLVQLGMVTKQPEFVDTASDGAEHLLSIADRANDGCRIYHHTPDGTDLYYLGWCHGPVGTARLFAQLYWYTGVAKWADALRGAARSVTTSGIPEQRTPGFWNNVSVCCGTAGVAEFSDELLHLGGIDDFASFTERLVENLLQRGTRDESGLRFVQAEHRIKPELLEAQSGYMQGASGIGLVLMHLYLRERMSTLPRQSGPAVVLPDDPFGTSARPIAWPDRGRG